MKEQITYDIFEKIDIRLGTVLSVKKNEKARKPSLVVEVDFGKEIGVKTSSAQITHFYNEENLVGKQVIGVCNFPEKNIIKIIKVPGAFEIPVTISKNLKKYVGFLALGCVIKGQTPHFDFISQASTDAIMKLSIDSKKPIGNGIITCLNMAQARARKKKGAEAAEAVISVLSQK